MIFGIILKHGTIHKRQGNDEEVIQMKVGDGTFAGTFELLIARLETFKGEDGTCKTSDQASRVRRQC